MQRSTACLQLKLTQTCHYYFYCYHYHHTSLFTVALPQMARLQQLMHHAKIHSLPVDDLTAPSDSDEEGDDRVAGLRAAQQRLKTIHQLYSTPSKSPSGQIASPRLETPSVLRLKLAI
jgi:hypothetical protein